MPLFTYIISFPVKLDKTINKICVAYWWKSYDSVSALQVKSEPECSPQHNHRLKNPTEDSNESLLTLWEVHKLMEGWQCFSMCYVSIQTNRYL